MRRFQSLRRSGDFARLRARGRRTVTQALTIFRDNPRVGDDGTFVGIVVSKSVGTAVVRNRTRRRLAACLQEFLPHDAPMRLLLIARPSAAQEPYAALCAQVRRALA